MKRKSLTLILILVCVVAALGVLASCNGDKHTHTFATGWTFDETYHWHAATCAHTTEVSGKAAHRWNQGEVTVPATHSSVGEMTYTCLDCGKTRTEPISKTTEHTFETGWTFDEIYHWHAATCEHTTEVSGKAVHRWNQGEVTVPATHSSVGETTYTCLDCGKTKTEPIQKTTEHTFATAWTFDETNHWHAATCEHTTEISGNAAHSFGTQVVPATCFDGGYTVHTCSVCGYSYTDSFTAPAGHTYATTYSFDSENHWFDATCEHTGNVSGMAAHRFTPTYHAPTCTAGGYTEYVCDDCGYSYTQTSGETPLSHNVTGWEETGALLADASLCKYVVTYSGLCTNCTKTVTKQEEVIRHNLYTVITAEATCKTQGTKCKYCANEGCSYHTTAYSTENFDAPAGVDVHNWQVSESNKGVTVYTCLNCSESKTTFSSKESTSAEVTTEQLAAVQEIELKDDLSIAIDESIKSAIGEAASNAGGNVSVSASTLEGNALDTAVAKLDDATKELLGNNPVYDFSISVGDQRISNLGGTATVRVPYTLGDNDPDNIIIWYISEGEITPIKAVYANGFVSFETEHFSLYTVGEITPAQYCEYYGVHSADVHVVAPTCTAGGYTVCLRCGEVIDGSETQPIAHEWSSEIISAPTCTAGGVMEYTCILCDAKYTVNTLAKGHNYVVDSSTPATCSEEGCVVYKCTNDGCSATYRVVQDKLAHNYISTVVSPTCTEQGYTEKVCYVCGNTVRENVTDALGHDYGEAWIFDGTSHWHECSQCGEKTAIATHVAGAAATEQSAETCTVCGYVITPATGHICASHLTKINAKAADCVNSGNTEYFVCECGKWYTDTTAATEITDRTTVVVSATGHVQTLRKGKAPTCTENGVTDCYYCSVCDAVISGGVTVAATGHKYQPTVVNPTCTEKGYTRYTCSVCADSYTANEKAALGHDVIKVIVAPSCTAEGYTTCTCSRCDYSAKENITPAIEHVYVYNSNETSHWRECRFCGNKAEEAGHVVIIVEGKAPTCTEAGLTQGSKCVLCGRVLAEQTSVAATGHSYGDICGHDDTTHWSECAVCHDKMISNHTITSEVTAPTCTKGGYTTYTCAACGYTYKADEVDELGHDYVDGVCSRCGKVESTQEEVQGEYYANLLTSLLNDDYTFSVKDLKLTIPSMRGTTFMEVDFAEINLSFDEEGNLYGFVSLNEKGGTEGDPFSAIDVHMEAILNDGCLYVKLGGITSGSGSGDGKGKYVYCNQYDSNYVKMPIASIANIFGGAGNDGQAGPPAVIGMMFGNLLDIAKWLNNDLKPILTTFASVDAEHINEVAENLFNILFTRTEAEDGYALTLDVEKVKSFNNNLHDYTLAEVVDIYFGEDAFENLVTEVKDLISASFGDLLSGAKESGFDTDALIAAVKKLFELVMGEGAFDQYEQMLSSDEFMSGSYAEMYANVINQARQSALGQQKRQKEMEHALKEAEGGVVEDEDKKEDTFVPVTADDVIANVEGTIKQFATMNVYDTLSSFMKMPADDAYAMVDNMIEAVFDAASMTVTTDADGNLDAFAVNVTAGDVIPVEGKISLSRNYESTVNYDNVISDVNNGVSGVKVSESLFPAGTTFTYDENGNVMTATIIDESTRISQRGYDIYDDIYCRYAVVVISSQTTVYKFVADNCVAAKPDCGDWYSYSIPCTIDSTSDNKVFVRFYNDATDELIEEYEDYEQELKMHDENGSRSGSLEFFYNVKTGEYKPNDDNGYSGYVDVTLGEQTVRVDGWIFCQNTLHDYVFSPMQSKAAVGCTGEGELCFVCNDCGHKCTVNYTNGHNLNVVDYVPATCISDGLRTEYCTVCGETFTVTLEKNPYAHIYDKEDGLCIYCGTEDPDRQKEMENVEACIEAFDRSRFTNVDMVVFVGSDYDLSASYEVYIADGWIKIDENLGTKYYYIEGYGGDCYTYDEQGELIQCNLAESDGYRVCCELTFDMLQPTLQYLEPGYIAKLSDYLLKVNYDEKEKTIFDFIIKDTANGKSYEVRIDSYDCTYIDLPGELSK